MAHAIPGDLAQPLLAPQPAPAPVLWNGRAIVHLGGFSSYYLSTYLPSKIAEDASAWKMALKTIFFIVNGTVLMFRDCLLTISYGIIAIPLIFASGIISICAPDLPNSMAHKFRCLTELHLSPFFFRNYDSYLDGKTEIAGNDPSLFSLSPDKQEALEKFQVVVGLYDMERLLRRLPRALEVTVDGLKSRGLTLQPELDPKINRAHLAVQLPENEIPEPPVQVNLEDLKHFYADIDLTKYVDHVNNGCLGLQGAPVQNTPEHAAFKSRLQKLAGNILYQLRNGNQEDEVKRALCSNLQETAIWCAPRHMEDSENTYRALGGNLVSLSPKEKIVQLTQKLRTENVSKIAFRLSTNLHMRTGVLKAIGEEFLIPGYNALNDPYAQSISADGARQAFHHFYTSDALVQRVSEAVNTPDAKNREIPMEKMHDWFKDNVPAVYKPELIGDERWRTYLTEEVYSEDMSQIKLEAIRQMLVSMEILNS